MKEYDSYCLEKIRYNRFKRLTEAHKEKPSSVRIVPRLDTPGYDLLRPSSLDFLMTRKNMEILSLAINSHLCEILEYASILAKDGEIYARENLVEKLESIKKELEEE